ncbi:MAG TPA: replicative DNA helicase [Planctomycetota bacterium]|nr:replicative DNA helicase [Planctomycetota bacterium]
MAEPASATMKDRLPPQNLDAEIAVLGSMLLDNQTIPDVARLLRKADFYSPDHQVVYEAALTLFDQGKPVDIVLLSEDLRQREALDRIGGPGYLISLLEKVPSAANAEYYANIVHQAALRRHLIHACTEIARECYDGSVDTDALLDKAQAEVFAVTQGDRTAEATAVRDILQGIFDDIESMRENRITGLRTWFNDLDDLTCGLQRSDLIIVAGRPSMGKTTLALNMALRVALGGWPRPNKADAKPVLLFSLEMSKPVIARNILCCYARVDAHRLRRGLLPREEINALTMKAGDLYEAPIYIDDTPGLSLRDLRTRARRLKMSVPGLALIVVDYLQLMEERHAENRQQEISIISRGLKGLARELDIPVIAISQLSRATEAREGHIPRMSDLRESGSLEQDADLIILLYRAEAYSPGERPGEADLIVAKQRNGPTGDVHATFLKNYLRFEDRSHQEQTPF